MGPARPYRKGYLKLALVPCPIALYTASSSTERVSLRQINKKTATRLRQQLVDEVKRKPVASEDKGVMRPRRVQGDRNASFELRIGGSAGINVARLSACGSNDPRESTDDPED